MLLYYRLRYVIRNIASKEAYNKGLSGKLNSVGNVFKSKT